MATPQDDEEEFFSIENEVVFNEDTEEATSIEEINKNTEAAANEIVAEEEKNEVPEPSLSSSKKTVSDMKINKKPANQTEPLPPRFKVGYNYANGKLIRLSKPATPDGIVDTVVFEFTDGQFAPWTFEVKNCAVYVFGYNLANANLAMHLSFEDTCTVKFKVRSKRVSGFSLWIGPPDVKPVKPRSNQEFQQWLKTKRISVQEFSNWVKNNVFFNPYFPWLENIYAANVIDLVWDDARVAVGAFLKLKSVYRQVAKKAISRRYFNSIALMPRDDFYVCGIPVGLCDLQMILKKNQSILVQIHLMKPSDSKRLQVVLGQKPDLNVRYQAYIGWVGNERPTGPRANSVGNIELQSYLSRNNLSVSEFEAMRDFGPMTQQQHPNNNSNFRPTLLPIPPEDQCCQVPIDMDIVEEDQPVIQNHNRPSHSGDLLNERDTGMPRVVLATKLIKSVFDIDSVDDPRIRHLLQSQEEVDIALKITTILSRAMAQRFEDTQMQLQQTRGKNTWETYDTKSLAGHERQREDKRSSEEYKSDRYDMERRSERSDRHASARSSFELRPEKPSAYERSYYVERANGLSPEYRSDYMKPRSPGRDYRQRSPSDRGRAEEVDLRRLHDDPRYASEQRRERDDVKRPRTDYYSSYIVERDRHSDSRNGEAYGRDQDLTYHRNSSPHTKVSSARVESYVSSHQSREQYRAEYDTSHGDRHQDLSSDRVRNSDSGVPSHWSAERVDEEFRKLSEQYQRMKELKARSLYKTSSRNDLQSPREY